MPTRSTSRAPLRGVAILLLFTAGRTLPLTPTATIFYASDEHGYLEPAARGSGPLGGGVWTGPAVSSWFQGASAPGQPLEALLDGSQQRIRR